MKQASVEKVIGFYKIWTVVLIVLFIVLQNCRWAVFSAWWISSAVLMLYLLCNILYLARLKKKLSEDKLKEVIIERNNRLARRANKMAKRLEEEE